MIRIAIITNCKDDNNKSDEIVIIIIIQRIKIMIQ